MKEDKGLCPHVWQSLDISSQREIKPCCLYHEVIADNISDYLKSPKLAKLKSDFRDGKNPPGCQTCWDYEASGKISKRQNDLRHSFNGKIESDKIKHIGLTFGNSCNLACRICSSYNSTAWIREERKLNDSSIRIYGHHKFYQDQKFIDDLKDISTDLTDIHVAGGEPFLAGVDEHLDYLDYLIAHGSENIDLHYNTNGSIFPDERFWRRFDRFKKIHVQLSIDATHEQFNYIRWPGDWDDVLDNMKAYKEKSIEHPNLEVTIGCVINIMNVYYFPEFCIWCLQNGFSKPWTVLLESPDYYSIQALPRKIKEEVTKKLKPYKFDEIINYMNRFDLEDMFPRFLEYTSRLDKQRKQDFSKTFSKFYQIIKDHDEATP